MSNELGLGKLITDPDAERDATHVAVIPMIAGERWMQPGDKIKLKYGTVDVALRANHYYDDSQKIVAVVDPFLQDGPEEGQRFWAFLFPGTVTGMRHLWRHPAFTETEIPKPATEHEAWIRDFCDRWNFDYGDLIGAALKTTKYHDDYDRYVVARGRDCHSAEDLGEDNDLFWMHLEGLMNRKFDHEHREGMGWSCSC